jgi:hypothetical protein
VKIIASLLVLCFLLTPLLGLTETTQAATTPSKIQKMVIAYSNTLSSDTNRKWIASHFDVLDCGSNQQSYVKIIKTLTPNLKALGYFNCNGVYSTDSDWSYINKQESWFVHSTTGARVRSSGYGFYLMNPNSGWSTYFNNKISTFLKANPQYNGVFLDNAPLNLEETGYTFTVSYPRFGSGIISNWASSFLSQLTKLKALVGSKIVMPNTWKYTDISEKATHAMFWENFIHGRNSAYSNYGTTTIMCIYTINALHRQAELGNIIGVNSGCKDTNLHPIAAKQWQKFTLACFMFAVQNLSRAYYSWQFINSDSSKGYFLEMDLVFGPPVADYKLLIKNTYVREFKYYYVIANLDTLVSSHFTLNGIGYTLAARNALFIKK